jgi:hypothetical protein
MNPNLQQALMMAMARRAQMQGNPGMAPPGIGAAPPQAPVGNAPSILPPPPPPAGAPPMSMPPPGLAAPGPMSPPVTPSPTGMGVRPPMPGYGMPMAGRMPLTAPPFARSTQ